MPERAAGILLSRVVGGEREVWIGHLGGPYWARRSERSWSIPKGLIEPGEEPLAAARREFAEEVGSPAPDVPYTLLGEYRYASGKRLTVFHGDGTGFDPADVRSNLFEIEWPPRSGQRQWFPELERTAWVRLDLARDLLVATQSALLADLPTEPR